VKKGVKIALALAVAAGVIGGGGYAVKKANDNSSPVSVYSVYYFSESSSDYGISSEMYGDILPGSSENYTKSESRIAEMYVSEGQAVTPGTALFKYDTSSLEKELWEAESGLALAKLNLQKSEAELARWQTYTPYTPYEPVYVDTETMITRYSTPYSGDGTQANPFVYHCNLSTQVIPAVISDLFATDTTLGRVMELVIYDGKMDADMVPVFTWRIDGTTNVEEKKAALEELRDTVGIWNIGESLQYDGSGTIAYYEEPGFAAGASSGTPLPEAPTYSESQSHTQDEIDQMVASLKREITSQQIDVKQAQLTYEKTASAAQDGIVKTECTGTVTTLADYDSVNTGETFLSVTSDEGLILQGTVSETDRDKMQPGTEVMVTSYMTGEMSTAVINYLSETPAGNGYSGMGNPNSSYYVFRANVSPDSSFTTNDWVGIEMLSEDTGSDTFYLQTMFVRRENGSAYVMKGENGRLVKQYVKTGRTIGSYMTEIVSGLSQDDYIAFPYGRKVKEGAVCDISENTEELYGY